VQFGAVNPLRQRAFQLGVALIAAVALLASALWSARPQVPAPGASTVSPAAPRLPVAFVSNRGQTDPRVRFYAQTPGLNVFVTRRDTVLQLSRGRKRAALRLSFPGARPSPRIVSGDVRPGHVSYFRGGAHPTAERALPSYGTVTYRDLWPGIDMTLRGGSGPLKYEFRVQPGAEPDAVRIALKGAEGLSLGAGGELLMRTPLGTISDAKPRTFQIVNGRRIMRESRFRLLGDKGYGFRVTGYDPSRPLLIDPGLVYSTFLGGSGNEFAGAWGVIPDAAGNVYVTGSTGSADFPTTPGAYDTAYDGYNDIFVTKLNSTGSAVLWSTFLGSAGYDGAGSLVLDGAGNLWIPGTGTENFPTTPGAYDTTYNGSGDGVIAELDPTGSHLLYSTYIGGQLGFDAVGQLALTGDGGMVISGSTGSSDFPTTPGAFQTSFNRGTGAGFRDDFVARLDPTLSTLVYSTYLGGSDEDQWRGLALDAQEDAYVTGFSYSRDFPTTPGAVQGALNDTGFDVTVSKLNSTGSSLVYSTYLGGSGNDAGTGIALDSVGNAYVSGYTGGEFPVTPGAFQTTSGGLDGFAVKLRPDGSLAYSTYLGGTQYDQGLAIAIDGDGRAYVAGRTRSTDYPTTADGYDRSFNGGFYNAFVSELDPTGSSLLYSTYLGGGGDEYSSFSYANSIALDGQGGAYISGFTDTADFVTTPGAYDRTFNGENDGFVAKLSLPTGTPVSTPGCKFSGSGRITAANGDTADFHGRVHVATLGARGSVFYVDRGPSQPLKLLSSQIAALVCSNGGESASVFGTATIAGTTLDFRIDVVDAGAAGRNDSYRLRLSNGYDSGEQRLERGNVEIRSG
jgi:Beta-propeller repeat